MEDQFAHFNTSAHSMEDRRRADETLRLRELGFSLIVESIRVPRPPMPGCSTLLEGFSGTRIVPFCGESRRTVSASTAAVRLKEARRASSPGGRSSSQAK